MFVTKIALSLSGRFKTHWVTSIFGLMYPAWSEEGRVGNISSPMTMYGQLECICSVSLSLSVRGVHPPWCIFPSVSDSPLFSKKFPTVENFQNFNLSFSRKILDFHPPKFLMTFFLVIDHKFCNSPLFSLFQYISPLFRKIHLLFTYFMCISFPPTLTMMHLCITQCTYWTPLLLVPRERRLKELRPMQSQSQLIYGP